MLAQLIRRKSVQKQRSKGRCTAIFSDVDGVILPKFPGGTPPQGATTWRTVSSPSQEASYYQPAILNALRKHPADHKIWLTSWLDDASDAFDDKVGQWSVLSPEDQRYEWWHSGITDWWKANLLLEWIAEHPEVTHVVWCEDELNDEDRVEAARTVYNEIRRMGVRLMVICPDEKTGLSNHHIDMINTFAKGGI